MIWKSSGYPPQLFICMFQIGQNWCLQIYELFNCIIRKVFHNNMKITFLPKSKTGGWSLLFLGCFVLFMFVFYLFVWSGYRGGDKVFHNNMKISKYENILIFLIPRFVSKLKITEKIFVWNLLLRLN